ncbi:MAG TPA: tetratricopeptide repeat protein [Pyrinomonadaceae bacterium]|nr:tetratricopeptide repeat protein [Pyrinomonadaceae bacterium]
MRYLLLASSLLLFFALPAQPQAGASARDFLQRGNTLMGRNKVAAAIETYTKAIELNPRYAEAYVRRGMARRAAGDLDGSIEDYEMASSINPKLTANNRAVAESYSNRGRNEFEVMKIEAAIEDLTKAIEISPDEADHYYRRGRALIVKEDFERAIADLDKALSMSSPRNSLVMALIYANRGMAKLLQGKEAEARSDFDKCIKLHRGDILESHVHELGWRIMLMRQRRAEQQKSIG